jgi:hypothetical protein
MIIWKTIIIWTFLCKCHPFGILPNLPEASPDRLSLSDRRLSYILLGDSISASLLVEFRFLAAESIGIFIWGMWYYLFGGRKRLINLSLG